MMENVEELERYLGLKEGFFQNLQSEDDWSLIVKLNSLIESGCSAMLSEALGKPELLDALAQVQMGTPKNGKLAFIAALKLLSPQEQKYIETLGWLRNRFVHNVASTQKTIEHVLAEMKPQRRKECQKYLFLGESLIVGDRKYSAQEVVTNFPAQAIWVSGIRCLFGIYVQIVFGKKRKEIVEAHINEVKKNGPIVLKQGEFKLA